MAYKRSSPEEILKRNARAYLGNKKDKDDADKLLKKWLKKK